MDDNAKTRLVHNSALCCQPVHEILYDKGHGELPATVGNLQAYRRHQMLP